MEAEYHTREALLSHCAIRSFVDWIADKPEGFKPGHRRMKY